MSELIILTGESFRLKRNELRLLRQLSRNYYMDEQTLEK